jgi:hypothetical protein
MIQLPPMKIAQGEPFAYDVTVTGQDWSNYTGTATFKTAPKAPTRRIWWDEEREPIIQVTATGDADGLIQFGLSATETATFPALERLGYFHRAVCEIAMTNAATGDVQRFQARVSVAAQI